MKKYIFLLILFLIQSLGFSQSRINGFDNNNQRHGFWTKYYEDTEIIRFSGEFNHGNEIGVFKFYDESGSLVAEKIYKTNSNICHAKLYNSKHNIVAEGDFKGKKKNGLWKYFSADKYLLMTEMYVNGKLDGEKITYYKNGEITEKSKYKLDKLNGVSIRFSDTGVEISKQIYKNGVLDGEVEYCNAESGDILIKGQYKKGKRVGKWKFFSDGKVVRTKDYDKNKSHK